MTTQLALQLDVPVESTFDNYIADQNTQIITQIKKMATGIGEQYLYIWGSQGVGCTHLLQAACNEAANKAMVAMYLPVADIIKQPVDFAEGLEDVQLLCLDGIENLANTDWEEAIFHVFNRCRARYTRLLIAGNSAPKQLSIQMPDLKSRLAWGVTYHIQPLSDQAKLSALQQRAKTVGLDLNPSVSQFLLNHCPRDLNQLLQTLDKLDKASLAEQRKLTIPFVKQVLAV